MRRLFRPIRVLFAGAVVMLSCLSMTLGGIAITLACVALTSGTAHAEDGDAIVQARADFQRALELEQARDFAGALRLFRRVGQVKMTPQVRYHIATCEENLGKMVAALGGYQLALKDSEGMHPGFIAEVEQSIEYLKGRIPKLVVERGPGADTAFIRLDGVELGAKLVGVEVPLDPGPHLVQASSPGYQDYSETVTLVEGKTERLVLELESDKKPAPAAPQPVEPRGASGGPGIAPYVVAGAGLTAVVVGAVVLGVSQGKAGHALELCGGNLDCVALGDEDPEAWSEANDSWNSARSLESAGWVVTGLGVAAVATGTVLYFLDPARRAEGEARRSRRTVRTGHLKLAPGAPRADAGLSLVGQF